jgi:hypothetical protein
MVLKMRSILAVDVKAKSTDVALLNQHAKKDIIQSKLLCCRARNHGVPPRNRMGATHATCALDVRNSCIGLCCCPCTTEVCLTCTCVGCRVGARPGIVDVGTEYLVDRSQVTLPQRLKALLITHTSMGSPTLCVV